LANSDLDHFDRPTEPQTSTAPLPDHEKIGLALPSTSDLDNDGHAGHCLLCGMKLKIEPAVMTAEWDVAMEERHRV
jgi:hypothetical protein